jgi:hypothetical protein
MVEMLGGEVAGWARMMGSGDKDYDVAAKRSGM